MEVAEVQRAIEEIYRLESRRIFATLIRLLGDFDLAEEAMHDAFTAAMSQWPRDGLPANPRAWLVSTGRFKAIDVLRRRARFDASQSEIADRLEAAVHPVMSTDEAMEDDRLRLIFTCCHPALPLDGQMALTLREVCGLSTEAIASAFLATAPTIAQRIVRAKRKIRDAGIPFAAPEAFEIPERMAAVLRVVYLVFNEGYSASSGESPTRPELSQEAIRLGRLLRELAPDPEVTGLLALMLLTESRREARYTADEELILLEDQDRSLWLRPLIEEGVGLVDEAIRSRRVGPYTLQAAIAAIHAEAPSPAATDWAEIVGLYELLYRMDGSPVIALNRAVAIAMRDGPEAGLAHMAPLFEGGQLDTYFPAHAARAELYYRLGEWELARDACEAAIALSKPGPERRFLEKRLRQLDAGVD